MGWESRTFKVHVSLKRNDIPSHDDEVDRLWTELQDELRKVVNQRKYERLIPDCS